MIKNDLGNKKPIATGHIRARELSTFSMQLGTKSEAFSLIAARSCDSLNVDVEG
jgi:hypothetical protein